MLSADKKTAMKKEINGSAIMSEKAKISVDDLINVELTISDYDRIDTTNDKTGEPSHFYAVAVKEYPDSFFLSGSALTKIIDSAETDDEDIRGEKIKHLAKVRTKSGQTFTPVNLL